ncbi:MAG: hypothetical protein GC160_05400 [Acidobacteria bacterium]|nr:hypothetical protein [Acidobacteriota bacterium]
MTAPARQALAAALAALLLAPPTVFGQSGGLQVEVVAGQGGSNDVNTRAYVEPVVEVKDGQGRPVADAEVTFRAPAQGPSVTFYGASRSTTVHTDQSGRAGAYGMMPNTDPGPFQIAVLAEHDGRTASAVIDQVNQAPPVEKKKFFGKKMRALVGIGVIVAIVAIATGGD